MVELLRHFPYPRIREIQERTLEILEREWHRYDVFVISAPTAYGKTALSQTIMRAFPSTSIITPTNMLVDQYVAEFPSTPTMSRLDSYHCEEWDRPCSTTRGKLRGFCKGCPAAKDLARTKYRGGPGVYNYHVYLAHKAYRDVLVVDEAHNLIDTIKDRMALRIWQHDYGYPSNMYSLDHIRRWIGTLPENKKKHKKIQALWDAVTSEAPDYIPQRGTDLFNGKGTRRGEPEERDCIRLLPVDISTAPPMFWPRDHVRKVILLSATIGPKDAETLGLAGGRSRVLYINAESPIDTSRRPIIIDPVVNVNRYNMGEAASLVGHYIRDVLAPRFEGQKGLVHATYQMAELLRPHLSSNPRFVFHTRENKKEMYRRFRDSPPEDGMVLVACGLYEGIDLPEDLGRWQVLSKIPWQSLGSPAVRHLADKDPEGYYWDTLRIVMQAAGRICRTPDDWGYTYVLDGTFERLWNNTENLRPAWFSEACLNPGEEVDWTASKVNRDSSR